MTPFYQSPAGRPSEAELARLADVADRARDYAQATRAASTLRAYSAAAASVQSRSRPGIIARSR